MQQALGERLRLLLPQQGITADEGQILVEGDGKTEACFQRRILIGDVMTPMAIGLLDAKTIHGMHAAELQAVCATRGHQ